MKKKRGGGKKPWVDPDDAPEWTAEDFARADLYEGDKLIRRGQPELKRPTPLDRVIAREKRFKKASREKAGQDRLL